MHSAGGLVSPETARDFPIRLLESGPAGGGLATALFGALAGKKDVISFDMGGTTAKACMIEDGRCEIAPMMEAARVHRFTKGSGLPIKAPVIDMIEIGAGGGSIAAIDEVGLLKVGPHSAGSDPGPACYGMGGNEPTVTDANLVLGYYDPGFFLGGRMSLDLDAARRAIATVAEPLGLSAEQAAWGIHKVVVESMAAAARVHLVEKGKDPRRYAMVGFGGAGPAHAADVARVSASAKSIIPPASGAASALGFLAAPLSFELVRSLPGRALRRLRRGCDQPHSVGDSSRKAAAASPRPASRRATSSSSAPPTCASSGRCTTSPSRCRPGRSAHASLDAIREAFAKAYSARYTSVYEGARMEAINFRVRCAGPTPKLSLAGATGGGDVGAEDQGQAPRLVRAAAPWKRRSMTATRCVRATRSPVPRSSRSARRPPSSRRAIAVEVDESLNLRIRVGRRRRARGDRHAGDDARSRRCAASRPIRSRSRSCGAASSTSSRRCGSPSAAPPSRW